MKRWKDNATILVMEEIIKGTFNSYGQIFLSDNRAFSIALLVVTFFDLHIGYAGFLSALLTNLIARLTGLNRNSILSGAYGFNSLLVGLGIGSMFAPSIPFWLVLGSTALLTLIITTAIEGITFRYGLPYLSISFLISIWIVLLAARQFSALELSSDGVYSTNEMVQTGGMALLSMHEFLNHLPLPYSLEVYFRSLGAILFQYHLSAGIVIAIGLLLVSRISFLLSLVGFYSAWLFLNLGGYDLQSLNYTYIGFNFILTAIAIGGFFLVASGWSFIWMVVLMPLVAFITSAAEAFFLEWQLPVYSLPFNLTVLLFLYFLKFRDRNIFSPALVVYQHFSAEKNLYTRLGYDERFGERPWFNLSLPFWGEWQVTQGHSGEFTHKDEWQHAWDFEIIDDEGAFFRADGSQKEHYYCFGKPVVAAADGWIEEVADGVEDNAIGGMNLGHNWGNSVVIRHAERLFSKVSHLKKNSITVVKGQWVKRGDIIGYVGNSGRSPRPHLHFQIQETPYVGSKTIYFPLSNYIVSGEKSLFMGAGIPTINQLVLNVQPDEMLVNGLHFIPGQIIEWQISGMKDLSSEVWEVGNDMYNNTYLFSEKQKCKAWFTNDGQVFRFTHFEGNRKTLLYAFYLGTFEVILGQYRNIEISSKIPLSAIRHGLLMVIQDFVAPFYRFISVKYRLIYSENKDILSNQVNLYATITTDVLKKTTGELSVQTFIGKQGIESIKIVNKRISIEAKRK